MASLTWWTWVWVNSGSWWWTGRPGVLQFMGSQRVGHDWATELNWTDECLWENKRDVTVVVLQTGEVGHTYFIHFCIVPWKKNFFYNNRGQLLWQKENNLCRTFISLMILSHSCFLNSDIISLLADVVESEKGLADPGSLRPRGLLCQKKGTGELHKFLPSRHISMILISSKSVINAHCRQCSGDYCYWALNWGISTNNICLETCVFTLCDLRKAGSLWSPLGICRQ